MEQIIIFGTAKRGAEVLAILSQLPQYEVVAFSCNDPEKWGMKKEGLEVISPQDMAARYPDAAVVLASGSHVEIRRRLYSEKLVPSGGCVHIRQIIGKLSDEGRSVLSAKVRRKTSFYNLAYRESEIPPDDGSGGRYLVICCGGYPLEGNPRCIFAHERVLQYRRAGLEIEAFGLVEDACFEEYEYQGVRVFQGSSADLERFLRSRNYRKFLIHFINPDVMYAIERAGKDDTPVIVWCHGHEVMPWYRCWFNYMPEELQRDKAALDRRDAEKKSFLRNVYDREDMEFVFVSKWQMERSKKFVGSLPRNHQVIHNFIDSDFYASPERTAQDRLRVLSIKNHGAKTYANDLTAKAILELSERSWFSKLTFELYGDGALFKENFGELLERGFPNVHIHRKYLSHAEMREEFQKHGIFLAPTRQDTQGVTANEAMAAGMAVISCNTSAIPEFMDESCASLFEYDNYWMMAEEIEYLYDHSEAFLRKAENARSRVVQQCGYESTIRKELALIKMGIRSKTK